MLYSNKQGVTLLELLLALAIATSIILFSFSQYSQYKLEQDFFAAKYNVDLLFQAMGNYYKANCGNNVDSVGNLIQGALVPGGSGNVPDPPTNAVKIDIANLIPGSFPNNPVDHNLPPMNPIIDEAAEDSANGFYAQFNPSVTTRQEYACFYYGTGSPDCTTSTPKPIQTNQKTVLLWVAQVVVKMKDPSTTIAYRNLVGANCAIDDFTPGDIVNCSTGKTSGDADYLVWQTLPSFASPNMSSALWLSTPMTKEFNLQYSHDPMYEMNNPNYGSESNREKYYLCGG